MKKIILMITIFGGIVGAKSQLHLGAKAGANISKIDGVSFNDNFKLGYQLGGYMGYDFSRFMGLQIEVQFNQTNTKVEDEFFDIIKNSFDKRKKLNYVSIPVLFKLNPQGLISVVAGPQFSFLTNGNESFGENSKKLFKKTDFGLVGGLELNLKPLIIYGRYVWGYSKVSDVFDSANSEQFQLGLAANIF